MSGGLKAFTKKYIVTIVMVPSLVCRNKKCVYCVHLKKISSFSNAYRMVETSGCRSICQARRKEK